MITLDTIRGTNGGGSDGSKLSNSVGQEEFLKLMVTQLKNQDPFSPMEQGEFLTQIAQFTTATGIQDMQQSFNRFSQNLATEQALQAAALVGREVYIESEVGYLPPDNSLTAVSESPVNLQNMTLRVYTEAGVLVREIPMGQQAAGEIPLSWDGTDEAGTRLPPGRYLIEATTVYEGEELALPTRSVAQVTSVTMGQGGSAPTLTLAGLGDVSLSAVQQIR